MRERFRFIASAYSTAQDMVRFVDEKGEILLLVYGVLLALASIRVDPAVRGLRSPEGITPMGAVTFGCFLAFLGVMFYAVYQAVAAARPHFVAGGPPDEAGRRRLYWCHDVLGKHPEAYLAALRDLRDGEILEEMAHELYDVHAIERVKFAGIARATRVSTLALTLWILTLALSFFV